MAVYLSTGWRESIRALTLSVSLPRINYYRHLSQVVSSQGVVSATSVTVPGGAAIRAKRYLSNMIKKRNKRCRGERDLHGAKKKTESPRVASGVIAGFRVSRYRNET